MRKLTIALWVQCSIFIALLGIGEVLHAQSAAYFQYTVRDGLPSNLVYCCVQDRRGLLWFGTDKGLACFDGQRFRTYGMQDGLPDPEVLWMKEDSKGRLWLCCFSKKPCYMLNGKIITEKEDTLLSRIDAEIGLQKVVEDIDHSLYFISTTKKIYRINKGLIEKYMLPENIYNIERIGKKLLFFSARSIYEFSPPNYKLIYTIPFLNNKKVKNEVEHAVAGNRILKLFDGYAFYLLFDEKSDQIVLKSYKKQDFGQVYVDRINRFWVATTSKGAFLLVNSNKPTEVFLTNNKVSKILEDNRETIWFCTLDKGVFALKKNPPFNFLNINNYLVSVQSLSIDMNNDVFVGDDSGNLFNIKKIKYSKLNAQRGYNRIRKSIFDINNCNWVASDHGIQYSYDNKYRITAFTASIKDIAIQKNKLWYSSSRSLGFLDLNTKKCKAVINRRFTVLNLDSDNNIWAGSINGLYAQKDSFQYNWGQKFPELAQRIVAMESAGPGKVWVVTPKDGLMRITVSNGEILSLEKTGMSLKIPIQNIQSLFAEPNGRLWMATNRGVYGLEPSSGKIIHFDTHDGLLNDDVNTVLVHQDTLWVGTVAGLTRIALRPPDDDGNFRTLISAMRYTFEKQDIVNWFMDSVEHRSDIFIPKEAANLEFDLAGLDYQRQGNLDFEVEQTTKALPLHQMTWDNLFSILYTNTVTHTQNDNATYRLGSFFPAGRYKLKVSAIKSSGVRSHLPDEWIIYKPPYWYQVIWFHLAILMAIFALLWRFYQTQKNLIKTKEEASTLQLMALQSQLNPHFIGNSVNSIQQFLHPPDPYKASEYISLFTRLLRNTMHFSEKTFVTFEEEYNYVREYLEMTKLRLENQFTYELIGKEDIPMDALFPSMLLQPLLENATIHGISPDGATHCVLVFSMDMGIIKCQLTDNGLGINYTKNKKEQMAVRRVSKGVTLLQKKISSINILYKLNLALIIEDLSELGGHNRGTRATITFKLRKNEGKNVA